MSLPCIQAMTPKQRLSLREVALLGVLAALMTATQVVMASLPNVHLVAVLVMLAALLLGGKSLYATLVFTLMESLLYGFHIWSISYLYIWPLLAIVTICFRSNRSRLFWSVVAAIHGLSFGALCAVPYTLAGGWAAGFSYWVAGIPFDVIHCVSNAVSTYIVLPPLYRLGRWFYTGKRPAPPPSGMLW